MSLGPFLLGAAVTLILTSVCSADICDLGPPGRFCLNSLVGYHECIYNRNTSKMEHHIVTCPFGTRCSCMGIPCKTSSPCQKFILPPVMPRSYRAEYNEKKTICSPAGCRPTYSRFAIYRDALNQRYKEIRTISNKNPTYEYDIVLPIRRWKFARYRIVPGTRSCTKTILFRFPPKIQVPAKFSYSGRRYVYGEYTKKWVWMSGGRHSGQGVNVQIWDTAQTIDGTPTVVQYTVNYPGSQMSRTSVKIDRYYYMFKPGVPSSIEFQLPTFCRR
ncbi:uncharacterized protein LOC116297518 [Actinia tenebrosa]|uniref:Uncharacterized protein LOC116297518 n=1 Tax=Actinia tenebrosa TaxID=6105 RepID=A0A6P8I943_ACTTE|nr:uncharacterized protein LOC116297518 [Actinia tenebrosa]XP_031561622.1 uncharacterized protein LOC116297518 [Actinia tenebrosa]